MKQSITFLKRCKGRDFFVPLYARPQLFFLYTFFLTLGETMRLSGDGVWETGILPRLYGMRRGFPRPLQSLPGIPGLPSGRMKSGTCADRSPDSFDGSPAGFHKSPDSSSGSPARHSFLAGTGDRRAHQSPIRTTRQYPPPVPQQAVFQPFTCPYQLLFILLRQET